MEDAMYSLTDYRSIGGTAVELRVSISDDFESEVGRRLENFGDITISSTSLENKEDCFWDNLDFFINATTKELKDECKKELTDKNLFEPGIFKLIKDMLKPFVKREFLKIRKS